MKTSELVKLLVRDLRKQQTKSEKILWDKLRNRKFAGLKFRRQHPVYYFKDGIKKFFIADFFCSELKLVLEIDGGIHNKQKDYDLAREEVLKSKSLVIIRFSNTEIETDTKQALIKLQDFIDARFPSQLSRR